MKEFNLDHLVGLGWKTIRELETEQGILASHKEEIYGCIFGRDSLITILKLLRAVPYANSDSEHILVLSKKVLTTLASLQGKVVNIESGEEPGKCIHEYRLNNHEQLTVNLERPWYVYDDGSMKNYDTVDATPLFLIAIYRHLQASKDDGFVLQIMPNIEAALNWVLNFGDSDNDGFIDYKFPPERTHGGLKTQSWMDSEESIFHEDGTVPVYPIAPVEVQAYAYLALRLWDDYFKEERPDFANLLKLRADHLKENFNEKFVLKDGLENIELAYAIDGTGKPLISPRSSMGHCLWASKNIKCDSEVDCIIENQYIKNIADRLMQPDLFEPRAGIRTLSKRSKNYSPNSYHNGSIWPHDNSLIADGLEDLGFVQEGRRVKEAVIRAIQHFDTPIELFVFDGDNYADYCSRNGQLACKKQAWSAASILSMSVGLLSERAIG